MYFVSQVARFRTAANSGTLGNGRAKLRAAREYDGASIYAHTPEWEVSHGGPGARALD